MKIRNGFVSNSSSTSFMFLFKTNDPFEIRKTVEDSIYEQFKDDSLYDKIRSSILNNTEKYSLNRLSSVSSLIKANNDKLNTYKNLSNNEQLFLRFVLPPQLKFLSKIFKAYNLGFFSVFYLDYGTDDSDENNYELSEEIEMKLNHYESDDLFIIPQDNH